MAAIHADGILGLPRLHAAVWSYSRSFNCINGIDRYNNSIFKKYVFCAPAKIKPMKISDISWSEQMPRDYEQMLQLLKSDNAMALNEAAIELESFPDGVDDFLHRRWVINAIDIGSLACVQWMMEKHVNLCFRDEEGYTPLHAAIDRDNDDKYEVLKTLLAAGALVNQKGLNDWTPAHMAAARNDTEALRVLVQFGADLSIRTGIDEYATPLEEAQHLGASDAVAYLRTVA